MVEKFNLAEYMNSGIEGVVRGIVKASLKNPKETAFILRYAIGAKEAQRKRESFGSQGDSIPAFLISSITSNCNLFCQGCYARANKLCGGRLNMEQQSHVHFHLIRISA